MRFPEKYVRKGDFVLHSGQRSKLLYDVNSLLTDTVWREQVLRAVPQAEHYVGIATAGAIIAALASDRRGSELSIVKGDKLHGKRPEGNWALVDDVTTTEASIKEAMRLIDKAPEGIFVVVDRRKLNHCL